MSRLVLAWVVVAVMALRAPAQGVPDYDFDWATIGDVNNPGYNGPVAPGGFPRGRGSVGYAFRMSRLEVTTAQWLEYVNAFTTQSDSMAFFLNEPARWGARSDLGYTGPGRRYQLDPNHPNPGLSPVGGIDWRESARFCNWLHGGKSADPATLDTGAYDTSTWGPGPRPGTYTDEERRLPGARFWIPSLDEWLKSAHFDPDKGGAGVGGWWLYNTMSDTAAVGGAPGVGESSVGTGNWRIPLGAYPQTTSAYGLLDLSGGASEWLEDFYSDLSFTNRYWDGSSIDEFFVPGRTVDSATRFGASFPVGGLVSLGLRIASIPCAGTAAFGVIMMVVFGRRVR